MCQESRRGVDQFSRFRHVEWTMRLREGIMLLSYVCMKSVPFAIELLDYVNCCHALVLNCFSGTLDVLWMLELDVEVFM